MNKRRRQKQNPKYKIQAASKTAPEGLEHWLAGVIADGDVAPGYRAVLGLRCVGLLLATAANDQQGRGQNRQYESTHHFYLLQVTIASEWCENPTRLRS